MTSATVDSGVFKNLMPPEKHQKSSDWCNICHSQRDPAASELNRTIRLGMQHLWQSEILWDYTIVAGGRHFRVHKAFVAAASDVLLAMLTVNMQETHQDTVELKAVTATGMQLLLEFIYTGQMPLNDDNIFDVVAAASHLQVRAALTECSLYLRDTLSTSNAVDVLNIANVFGLLSDVVTVACDAILESFEMVVDDKHHLKLEKKDFENFLLSDKLHYGPEEKLFECIVEWTEHDPDNRSKYAPELLGCLRLFLVSPNKLESVIAASSYYRENEQCAALLEEARSYHKMTIQEKILTDTFKDRVRSESYVVTFGGISGNEENHHCYALEETDWLQLPDMQHSFRGGAVAVVNNFLIACGGIVGTVGVSNTCHVFDPRTYSWHRLPPMIDRRGHFPLVFHEGYLYAFGGCCERIDAVPHFINTKKIERYSLKENKWESVEDLSSALRKHSACSFGGVIYISGGIDEMYMSTSRLQSYNPTDKVWTDCAEMNNVRFGHAMVPLRDRIYIADPMNREIEYYLPAADQWTKMRITFSQLPDVAQVAHNSQVLYFINGKLNLVEGDEEKERVCMEVFPVRERTATCVEVAQYPKDIKDPVCCSLKMPWNKMYYAKTVSRTTD